MPGVRSGTETLKRHWVRQTCIGFLSVSRPRGSQERLEGNISRGFVNEVEARRYIVIGGYGVLGCHGGYAC